MKCKHKFKNKKEALAYLKNVLPDGDYIWYQTYRANTGKKGMKRDILATEKGDYYAPYDVAEEYLDNWLYPDWAEVYVYAHWKLITIDEFYKLNKGNGPSFPVIIKIKKDLK